MDFRHRSPVLRRALAPVGLMALSVPFVLASLARPVAAAEPRQGVVSFSHSAMQEVEHDQMRVVLQVVREGAQPAEVQKALRQALDAGLTEARKAVRPGGALEVRTGQFSVSPRYGTNGRTTGWQGVAQLVIEGTDMAGVAQLVTRLQPLTIAEVGYGLSRETRQARQSAVVAQAIAGWRGKAAELASAFGQPRYVLGEVSVSSDEGMLMRPVMMARAAQADLAATPPLPVEPGRGQISVTVSGSIVLQP